MIRFKFLLFPLMFCGMIAIGLTSAAAANQTVIENQSFWVILENWGKVRFVSIEAAEDTGNHLKFCLMDERKKNRYQFPDFYGNIWTFYEMKAVAFKDVNNDKLKDVIVIADYMTGAGPQAAELFPVAGVYFQKGRKFVCLPKLDQDMNDKSQNADVKTVLKFVSSRLDEVNRWLEQVQ